MKKAQRPARTDGLGITSKAGLATAAQEQTNRGQPEQS